MKVSTQRLYHCWLDRNVLRQSPSYIKNFHKEPLICPLRYFATRKAHPFKSGIPPAEIAPSKKSSGPATPSSAAAKPRISASNLFSNLNPPSTARPPILSLPSKSNPDPIYKYYYKLGKAYLMFYKTGLKGVYANYKIARALPNLGLHPLWASRRSIYAAAAARRLSRADLQLLLRLRADTKVLPLFALVLACCGEFTPLLVPWLTAIVPPSVHIPTQTRKIRETAEQRRQQARLEGPPEWRNIKNIWDLRPPEQDDKYLQPMFRRLARELALYPPWFERVPLKKLYMMLVELRLGRRLSELKYDDLMLIRDGGANGLIPEEVMMACDRRGLAILGKETAELRAMLDEWLMDRDGDKAKALVEWLQGSKVDWKAQDIRK